MTIRLYVANDRGELDAVQTATEDDFMFFRDSVHLALEDGKFASRYPILFKTFYSDWSAEDVPELERELKEIEATFSKMAPNPPDENWRRKLRISGRFPASLAEVFVTSDGSPLIARLIKLARTARENALPVRWGEAVSPASNLSQTATQFTKDQTLPQNARLISAVEVGDLKVARDALEAGASANATRDLKDEFSCTSSTPALYTACARADAPMVQLLLGKGADPNMLFRRRGMVDFETRSCLIAAMPHVDIVRMLLNAGADPDLGSSWGEDRTTETSPLSHAHGNPVVVSLLRARGAR